METEQNTLTAWPRDASVKRSGRKTVAEGFIPAVVYGGAGEPANIKVNPKPLGLLLAGPFGRNLVFDVVLDGGSKTWTCMVKDTQFNPVRRELTHLDLYVVTQDQEIVLEVPVTVEGRSVGEKAGGRMQIVSRVVKVRCAVKDIPVAVPFQVDALDIGDTVYVDEMTAPEGCTIEFKNRFPVIRVAARRGAAKKAEAAEGAAAPAAVAPA